MGAKMRITKKLAKLIADQMMDKHFHTMNDFDLDELQNELGEFYYDEGDNRCTLERLCRDNPEWAANRIRYMTKMIMELNGEGE